MIATTIEQSKRLLEAGYNQETADMSYIHGPVITYKDVSRVEHIEECPPILVLRQELTEFVPAWSLSAIWDIFVKSGIVLNFETDETTSSEVLIDMLVQNLVNAAEGKVNLEINEEFLKK